MMRGGGEWGGGSGDWVHVKVGCGWMAGGNVWWKELGMGIAMRGMVPSSTQCAGHECRSLRPPAMTIPRNIRYSNSSKGY